ncbi:MAG: DUF1638 domain-containing protein [Synergistaceae bacterium]|nr:DUF1638 domain-containing protein [Synergistaceae bacterium]
MNCIIMACGSLTDYVRAAQRKLGTNYPEIYLDKALHADPAAMRLSILEKLASLPAEYDTLLIAMGFCGGSWKDVRTDRKIVRPRVDDCVSLLLHTETSAGYNLKKEGRLYMKDVKPDDFDIERVFEKYTKEMESAAKEKIKSSWKASYSAICVVDTGINSPDTSEYRKCAEKNASWIDGKVERLKGSNLLIEKLISGDWDERLFFIE